MENSKKPEVSVIMNCLNCSAYLKEAIDSVFAQTYKNWEIIFWDDASTDNSSQIANNYGEKVKCFKSDKTHSLGESRNLAIEKASGKYLAFLDCDDVWLPEKLEKQIPMFSNDSKIGLVYSNAICFNEKGNLFNIYGNKKPPEGEVFRQLLAKNFLSISTVVIKKEALLGLVEWFDNRFSCIEDMDLFLRLSHDWKIKYASFPLVKYRMHEGSWTYTHKSMFPDEQEILIKKFLDLYPNFAEDYKNGLRTIQARIGYERFIIDWEADKRTKARLELKPYILFDKKMMLPYILSYFLPFSVYIFFLRILKMKIYST